MRFMLLILIPYLLLALAYFFGLRAAFRSRAPSRGLFRFALMASLLLTLGFIAWGFHEIEVSTSSTAAIGYLALPYMALIGAGIGFLLALAVGVTGRFVAERAGWVSTRLISMPKLIGALLFLLAVGWAVQHNIARSRLLDTAAETTDATTLQSFLKMAIDSHDLELQAELAINPVTPALDLVRLFDNCKKTLSDPLSPDYRLFHALAWNPHTPTDILTNLAESPFDSILFALASNPSTPTEILKGLIDHEDPLIQYSLAENPSFPDELRPQLNVSSIEEVIPVAE